MNDKTKNRIIAALQITILLLAVIVESRRIGGERIKEERAAAKTEAK